MLKIGIECESIEDRGWGVGRIISRTLEELSKRPELKNRFRFFLYFKSKIPPLPFLNNEIFVKKIVRLPLVPPSFSLYYYILLPIKLRFEKLDLVFFPNYMLPFLFRGKSLVVLTEDIYYEINSGTLPWRYKMAYKIFAGHAARQATKIVAISETSKREASRLFKINPERIAVNALGVDSPNPQIKNFKLKTKNYILYVGQAFPRRHLRETMLGFERIAPDFPDLSLVAIGTDKYTPPIIKKLVEDINRRLGRERIIHKEYVLEKELVSLYANARCSIYVSSKEAFGLPPLEALSYGTPPVVADSELNHEIYGDNAFFACPEPVEGAEVFTPESIARTVIDALQNEQKRRQIIAAAPKILEKYTWVRHADRFLETIKNVIHANARD